MRGRRKTLSAIRYSLSAAFLLMLVAQGVLGQMRQVQPGDADKTLEAMRDEMARSKARLVAENSPRPYFVEYRLLDLDVRTVTASFGAILSSTTARNRFMSVDARVGSYQLDSSNFITDDSFRGFIGSTGTVGIDRDYDSLRQDLWLATDQAYKAALVSLANKQGFIRSLAKPPDIPDFSAARPLVQIGPRPEPDIASRKWEDEARAVSAVLRNYPQLFSTRITYNLIYATTYLMNSEGTEIRSSRSLAAIEASLETQAEDGMPLHNLYTAYAATPVQLPAADQVRQQLNSAAQNLVALRDAPAVPDYNGPVLFEAKAAASLVAQMVGPSLGGSRPPLSMLPVFDQIMERMGGRSEWSGSSRLGTRVLPTSVTLVSDPTAKEFGGQALLGGYEVDEEGVRGERVTVVDSGILKSLLMSRRPGPEFDRSNGSARAGFLGEPRPAMSNLFFTASDAVAPAELRKRFLDKCREEGRQWCLMVRQMDNPVVGLHHQEDLSDLVAGIAAGAATGDRLPLFVYKVNVADGKEELVRGARLNGLTLRVLRNVAGIGNDATVFTFMQNQQVGLSGTALAAFGSAQGGLPTSVVAPSLLFDEVEVRGPRGGLRRTPLLPAPSLE